MYTRKELEEKFTYKKVKQLVEEDENYSSIGNIVTFRTEIGGREVNEFAEEVREEIIDGAIKEQERRKIDRIEGLARTIVKRRIEDRIGSDRQERKYKQSVEHVQNGWSNIKGKKHKYKAVDNGIIVVEDDFRLKQIILECLDNLKKDHCDVLKMCFDEEKTIGDEIAEQMGKTGGQVSTIKHAALGQLKKALTERLGPEIEDIRGRLHDISVWQQVIEQHPEMLEQQPIPPEPILGNNPELDEETKEYMDMLLHSLYDVAKTMPISDMMDEYLFGRLNKEQKELFEKHLMECNDCYEDFKERRTILSALLPVLDDIE